MWLLRGTLCLQVVIGLSAVAVADTCFVIVSFFSAQWKDCFRADIVEAQLKVVKETGCFHITQDIPLIFVLLQGPVT